jgi:anaerobic magnesium-protoporphyrin IX monomethyl ester cyclase
MRVLFVFPDLSSDVTHYTGVPSYGVALLSAVLKAHGHETALYHMVESPGEEEFRERVRAVRPDLVAFSSNSHYARRLRDWTAWAREASGAPVAVGGIHATLAPEDVASLPAVSYTCVGEGETALPALCRALETGGDPSGIANLWARNGSGLVRNDPGPIWRDLDELPDPDLSVFDFAGLYPVRRGTFSYLMSRGCAFGCTYCCVHRLRNLAPTRGGFWRFLSPERATSQLRALIDRYMPGAAQVNFLDAILFPNRKWLEAFAPLYRERIGLPFSCNMRADLLNPQVAEILAGMGCRVVRMGVESGDQTITTEVLERRLDIDDIRRGFAVLREHGIRRWSYNMVGLPDETLAKALKTVRLNAEIQPDLALAFIFYPYPGTRLHDVCRERGWLTTKEFDHYQVNVTTRIPSFPADDILFVHRFFNRLIRLYGLGRRLPGGLGAAWPRALDAVITSPAFPRTGLVRFRDGYKRLRHRAGEYLVRRSPTAYRLLGGTDPA